MPPEVAGAEATVVKSVPAVAVAAVVDTGGHLADGAVWAGKATENSIHYLRIERQVPLQKKKCKKVGQFDGSKRDISLASIR